MASWFGWGGGAAEVPGSTATAPASGEHISPELRLYGDDLAPMPSTTNVSLDVFLGCLKV